MTSVFLGIVEKHDNVPLYFFNRNVLVKNTSLALICRRDPHYCNECLNICSELNDTVIEAQLRTKQVPPRLPTKTAIERYLQSTNRLLILVCCLSIKLATSKNISSCFLLVLYTFSGCVLYTLSGCFLLATTHFISLIHTHTHTYSVIENPTVQE